MRKALLTMAAAIAITGRIATAAHEAHAAMPGSYEGVYKGQIQSAPSGPSCVAGGPALGEIAENHFSLHWPAPQSLTKIGGPVFFNGQIRMEDPLSDMKDRITLDAIARDGKIWGTVRGADCSNKIFLHFAPQPALAKPAPDPGSPPLDNPEVSTSPAYETGAPQSGVPADAAPGGQTGPATSEKPTPPGGGAPPE